MNDVLIETYDLISRLESEKPAFGLQERLFLTNLAFHSVDMEYITSTAERMATEKRELTTGYMDIELENIESYIDETDMIKTLNLSQECMNLQEKMSRSFDEMDKIYLHLTDEYELGKKQADSRKTIINLLQAFKSEVNEVQSIIKKIDKTWERFFRDGNWMKDIKEYASKNADYPQQVIPSVSNEKKSSR